MAKKAKWDNKKFIDGRSTIKNFYNDVDIVCPSCKCRAKALNNFETRLARISCIHCGHTQERTLNFTGKHGKIVGYYTTSADYLFDVALWLQARFRDEFFWACNDAHLDYLEQYIGSGIRENKDRTGFTMVEKLPKFMQIARNREPLLKLIAKLRSK